MYIAGIGKLLEFSAKETKPTMSKKKSLGMLRAYPKENIQDSFRSKDVVYVIVQETNVSKGPQNVFQLENMLQFVEQTWCCNRVLSVGVPVENDDIEGSASDNTACEELVSAWKEKWSRLNHLPEIFICSSVNSSGRIMGMIDKMFKNSSGFAKRTFTVPKEGRKLFYIIFYMNGYASKITL